MRMNVIIISIKDAINKKCFLPALALSLVVPDICAQYDYPEFFDKKKKVKYNGHTGQGAAYAKWYDENIGKYDISPKTGIGLIDGWECWKLRCGFLHSASIDIDDKISTEETKKHLKIVSSKFSNFDYGIGGISGVEYTEDKKDMVIKIDIANLCGKILAVLEHSYLHDEDFINTTEKELLNHEEINYGI